MNQPIPLFLDVDGVLVVYRHTGSETSHLRTVPLDRRSVADAIYPGAVSYNPDVITELNALVDEQLVELAWLSSWDGAANRLLAPALGLTGAPFAVAEIGTRFGDRVRAGVWVKTLAVGRWMAENRQAGAPLILVDDLLTEQSRGQMSAQRRSLEDVVEPGSLLLATDAACGLLFSQVAEIRNHAQASNR